MMTTCTPIDELLASLTFSKFVVRGESSPQDVTHITVSRKGVGSFRFSVTHHFTNPVKDSDQVQSFSSLCEEITETHPREGHRDFESPSYLPTYFSNDDQSTYTQEDYRRLVNFRRGIEAQLKLTFEDIQAISTLSK